MYLIRPGIWSASLRKKKGGLGTPIFPIISRGLPYTSSQGNSFGGVYDEANAIDADYGSTWNSIFTPNSGTPQWYCLDLRGVAAGNKTNVWLAWNNWHGFNPYEPTAPLGSQAGSVFSGLPRNYLVQGHTSSGSQPAVGDVGWTTLVTVTDNRYMRRVHTGLNLSTYNWFRMYFTEASGVTGANDTIELQFDLRNANANGTNDSILAYGDSITAAAWLARKPGNGVWVNAGPIENQIQVASGRVAPCVTCVGYPGYDAPTADTQKALYIGAYPHKYVTLNFGSNDANLANIDLNDPGVIPNGISSNYAQNFKTKMQSMITYAAGLGKVCIIPKIPFGNLNTWSQPNLIILNTIIDQLIAANPTTTLLGPDFYTFFAAHTNLLEDHLHLTYDETNGAKMYNGFTGYEWMHKMWADWFVANLY